MSEKQNKELVRQFVDALKNGENLGAMEELMHPDFTHHFGFEVPPGIEGAKVVGEMIHGAFPDVRVDIQFLVAEDDKVVERSNVRATHQGEFMGIDATGKEVTWTENHIYRIADGKIAEHWPEGDLVGVLHQIGALGNH